TRRGRPAIVPGEARPQRRQWSHWRSAPTPGSPSPPPRSPPFLPPPSPTVTSKCPQDCTGIAVVTVSARNPVTWSSLQILPILNGRRLTNHVLRLGPGRSGAVSFRARDVETVTLAYVYPNSPHPPYHPAATPPT